MKMKKWREISTFGMPLAYIMGFVCVDSLIRLMAGYDWFSLKAILFSISFSSLLAAIGLLFKGIARPIFYSMTFSLISIIAVGQLIYYRFYQAFFSVNQMTNLMELSTVSGEIFRVLELKYSLFLIPTGFVLLACYWFKSPKKRTRHDQLIIVTLTILSVILSTVTKLTFTQASNEGSRYKDDVYLYETLFDKGKAMSEFGLYQYTLQDIKLAISHQQEKTQVVGQQTSEIDDYFQKLNHTHIDNEMSGIFEGKNVVYIMAESLFSRAIHEQATPTLYKLMNEGIYFENYYSPHYKGTTSDSEFISNTSLVPSVNYGTTCYEFTDNAFPNSIASVFKKAGYSATSYHSNTGEFYNRDAYHESLGYDAFYDQEALGLEFLEEWEYMVNWPSDADLMNAASDIFLEDDRFFSYVITTNGHTPYTTQRTELQENYDYVSSFIQSDDEEIVYYYAAQNAFDQSIEVLMGRLLEAGVLDETVLVIYGDHYPYPIHHDKLWAYDSTNEWDWQELRKVPLMIWTPGIEAQTVSKVMNVFDLVPTMANLFNLDYDYEHAFGIDIFSELESTVIFEDYGWITGHARYNKYSEYYESFDEIGTESYMEEMDVKVIEMFEIGQKVLRDDYFKR